MKIKLKSVRSLIPGQIFWQVSIDGATPTCYEDYVGAYEYVKKKLKREFKEQAAFSRLGQVAINLCNTNEADLIEKLIKSKCKGITKAQYGFLVGIYERQKGSGKNMSFEDSNSGNFLVGGIIGSLIFGAVVGGFIGLPAYNRYQDRQQETNVIQLNELKIQQTAQLVQVEKQKAEIRVVEADGISKAQHIINATLTDKYLQHEAITAQEKMANSPNHTTIYIPSGQNGIPIVTTVKDDVEVKDSK